MRKCVGRVTQPLRKPRPILEAITITPSFGSCCQAFALSKCSRNSFLNEWMDICPVQLPPQLCRNQSEGPSSSPGLLQYNHHPPPTPRTLCSCFPEALPSLSFPARPGTLGRCRGQMLTPRGSLSLSLSLANSTVFKLGRRGSGPPFSPLLLPPALWFAR